MVLCFSICIIAFLAVEDFTYTCGLLIFLVVDERGKRTLKLFYGKILGARLGMVVVAFGVACAVVAPLLIVIVLPRFFSAVLVAAQFLLVYDKAGFLYDGFCKRKNQKYNGSEKVPRKLSRTNRQPRCSDCGTATACPAYGVCAGPTSTDCAYTATDTLSSALPTLRKFVSCLAYSDVRKKDVSTILNTICPQERHIKEA